MYNPLVPLQFFVVAVAGLTSAVIVIAHWIGLPFYWQRSPALAVALVAFGYWLIVNIVFHYYMAVQTPPGVPPANGLIVEASSICKKCIAPKPPRTHHCSVCRRCVLKMDHHCRECASSSSDLKHAPERLFACGF